ncbi:hypothetical protein HanRHA438_Chr04g0183371 [Helianthus annuus]|uniref:Uncharacterized protein n=1 Tax=Helianthus annuus TaxID=4232 RepID=A0A9K3J9G8_HELAN|nr:hypothetical protein HanXRQr2_Chr04g0173671 [Helianthus annuus]KAJ0581539.1 hypothetical protein HanHA300_Chr04g0142191 [Helianthus annuus]KAJ0589527.1 hypothetical protein HanIR_Chr04g0187251 [Helianthus annuus]KAJ0597502.1 hypothetical protein HanHA89_Chr04g0155341 [Helianthus annuus]KAJ0758151.1 hypothetical protein HanLR1_Chr04g0147081 [Helianthus annuus]
MVKYNQSYNLLPSLVLLLFNSKSSKYYIVLLSIYRRENCW